MVLWFVFGGGVNLLTLLLSIEAIYIGVFILMTQNWERQQDMVETRRERERHDKRLEEDIHLDKTAHDILSRQSKQLKEIAEEIRGLQSKLTT
jgi:uncharacterized membrane protein